MRIYLSISIPSATNPSVPINVAAGRPIYPTKMNATTVTAKITYILFLIIAVRFILSVFLFFPR